MKRVLGIAAISFIAFASLRANADSSAPPSADATSTAPSATPPPVASASMSGTTSTATAAPNAGDATKIFSDALDDERAKKFADALEKWRRVAALKDGARVRFHIATCLAALGRWREARDAFGEVHANPQIAEEQDVELAALEQKSRLAAKIPDVTVKLTGDAKGHATIIVDGRGATANSPLEVDPGDHTIVAEGPGLKRVELHLKIAEGKHEIANIEILTNDASRDADLDEARSRKHGVVVLGAAGALLATTLVIAFVRNDVINSINNECPQDVCVITQKPTVKSQQDTANVEGAIAVSTGIATIFAAGIGAYLVIHPKTQTTVTVAPTKDGAWLRLGGTF